MPSELHKLWKIEDDRAVRLGLVPLGFVLSTVVFSRFWSNISALMEELSMPCLPASIFGVV